MAAANAIGLSATFIVRWSMTLVLPAMLLALSHLTLYSALPDQQAIQAAIVLPYLAWVLIAFLQFHALRGAFRYRRLWLAMTIVGGAIGHIGGNLVQVLVQTAMDRGLLYGADFIYATADNWVVYEMLLPYGPMILGGAANFLILALAQSYCFTETLRERMPWVATSLAAGLLGSAMGVAVWIYSWPFLRYSGLLDFISTPVMFNLVPFLIGFVVNLAICGLLAGICMRILLNRRAAGDRAVLMVQF